MRNVSDKEREKLSAEIAGLESLDVNQLSRSKKYAVVSVVSACRTRY